MTILLRFVFTLLSLTGLPARADDFLDPDDAFKFSVQAIDAHTLQARWEIADGYYLYHQKFKFVLNGAKLGQPVIPAGVIKRDDAFGKIAVHRKEVVITLPVQRGSGGVLPVTLEATYQGCADAGLCYTPITQTRSVVLAALPPPKSVARAPRAYPHSSTQSTAPSATSAMQTPVRRPALPSLTENAVGPMDIVPPDKAFHAEASLTDPQTLTVNYAIDPCCYLYRDRLKFAVKIPAGITIDQSTSPPGDIKDDPAFGKIEVYHHNFEVKAHLSRAPAVGQALDVSATYQGCNQDVGVCYPPTTQTFNLTGITGKVLPAVLPPGPEMTAAPAEPPTSGSEVGQIERVLKGGSFWAVMGAFFGFGLLLSLTPCVFPMIPILSGIIAGKKGVTKSTGFFLALAYVLGMAITYAIAGVLAAKSGTMISNALQNPIALGIGAAIFLALAFSMFGFFELQLPSALQSKLTEASNKLQGGHLTGVFSMGALSALIVGPCVAPPLAAALAYIAQTGNVALGGWALFSLALGMGTPLLAVGLSAGALLPKAGRWMNGVKAFFGVLMIGVAIWLISPLLPDWVNMLMWAALLIISAVYLHALDSLPPNSNGWMRLWKGVGVVSLIAGLSLVLGALGGSRDILQPLAVYKGGMATGASASVVATTPRLKFEKVASISDLETLLNQAKAAGKPVMLDFFADWCVSCKEMDKFTLADSKVQDRLKTAVLLEADVTGITDNDKALLKHFGLFGPPGIIFWNAAGQQSDFKVVGYEPADTFRASLDQALR
ncbi:MAG: protein-disulfide reductase DsbD [Thiobacillaceae bacterium]